MLASERSRTDKVLSTHEQLQKHKAVGSMMMTLSSINPLDCELRAVAVTSYILQVSASTTPAPNSALVLATCMPEAVALLQ